MIVCREPRRITQWTGFSPAPRSRSVQSAAEPMEHLLDERRTIRPAWGPLVIRSTSSPEDEPSNEPAAAPMVSNDSRSDKVVMLTSVHSFRRSIITTWRLPFATGAQGTSRRHVGRKTLSVKVRPPPPHRRGTTGNPLPAPESLRFPGENAGRRRPRANLRRQKTAFSLKRVHNFAGYDDYRIRRPEGAGCVVGCAASGVNAVGENRHEVAATKCPLSESVRARRSRGITRYRSNGWGPGDGARRRRRFLSNRYNRTAYYSLENGGTLRSARSKRVSKRGSSQTCAKIER